MVAFGGDGDAITIFGQSAGGNSVINHLAAPRSAGLFRAAIIESGAYDKGAQNLSVATHNYNKLINFTRCTTPECLSLLSTQTILNAFPGHASDNWGPVVDGVELTAAPADLIAEQHYNNNVCEGISHFLHCHAVASTPTCRLESHDRCISCGGGGGGGGGGTCR